MAPGSEYGIEAVAFSLTPPLPYHPNSPIFFVISISSFSTDSASIQLTIPLLIWFLLLLSHFTFRARPNIWKLYSQKIITVFYCLVSASNISRTDFGLVRLGSIYVKNTRNKTLKMKIKRQINYLNIKVYLRCEYNNKAGRSSLFWLFTEIVWPSTILLCIGMNK